MEVLDSVCRGVSGDFQQKVQQLLLRLCLKRSLGCIVCSKGLSYLAATVAAEQQELEAAAALAAAEAANGEAASYKPDTSRRHGAATRNRSVV